MRARLLAAMFFFGLASAFAPVAAADVHSGWSAYITGHYAKALAELAPLARQGNAEAQYYLGCMYSDGLGVPRDPRKAAMWFERAARQGHREAAFSLGFLLYYGAGEGPRAVAANPVESAIWLKQAADQGITMAQHLVAGLYRDGRGVPVDPEAADKWTLRAAEQGLVSAQYDAGLLYARRQSVTNVLQAYKWLELATRARYPGAIENREKVAERLTLDEIQQARRMADAWRPSYDR